MNSGICLASHFTEYYTLDIQVQISSTSQDSNIFNIVWQESQIFEDVNV